MMATKAPQGEGMQEILFRGEQWGVVAGMDEGTLRFKYPLTLTGVRPFSEAACAGLRSGDQVVSLHPGPGRWNPGFGIPISENEIPKTLQLNTHKTSTP